jgi:hypothetical protein
MKVPDELRMLPDDGQMRMWASQGYMHHISEDIYDNEITYNVNMRWLKEINNIKPGNLVSTPEEEVALVLEFISKDLQGFDIYKVLVNGEEHLYSTLELANVGD